MRIVQVVFSLDMGGQERLVLRMAQAFHGRGHLVEVVTLTGGGGLSGELGPIKIHEVARVRPFDPTLYPRLFRLFRSLKPDVVHTHNSVPFHFAAPPAKIAGARTVHTKHGHIAYTKTGVHLGRLSARFVDCFVAVSADTAETAKRWERPNKKRLSVIENGIPLDKFRPDEAARAAIREELGIPRDAVIVGSVGRLVEEKDYPLLVRATAPLLSERVRVVIVGEGMMRGEIEAAVAEIEPQRRRFVTLAGERRDVPRVLAAYDIFVLSSRAEGLPLVIPEAMASRLPVVATAVGGIPGVVPKETGVLVPHGDPEKLRVAIEGFVNDAATRRSTGEAARRYALERFGEERMLERYLALYKRP